MSDYEKKRRGAVELIGALNPCADWIEWSFSQDGVPAEIWTKCPRPDWLLWLIRHAGVDKQKLAKMAMICLAKILEADGLAHVAIESIREVVKRGDQEAELKKLARLISTEITWAEVEKAVAAGKGTPRPSSSGQYPQGTSEA